MDTKLWRVRIYGNGYWEWWDTKMFLATYDDESDTLRIYDHEYVLNYRAKVEIHPISFEDAEMLLPKITFMGLSCLDGY